MGKSSLPYVSVILPIYKTPLFYLKGCLDSLHKQTLSNTEFIIVFDGNDESLYSYCQTYKKKDNRFEIFIQPHSGVSAARNLGIKKATGEYVTFVDADDWIDENCCEETYAYAKETESETVLFDYNAVSNQYHKATYSHESIQSLSSYQIEELQKQSLSLTDEKYVAAVSTWCKLIKRNLIIRHNISFPINAKIAVDRPFSYSVFTYAKKISYLCKTFYNYNKLDNSITWKKYSDKLPLLLTHLSEIKKISNKHSDLICFQAIRTFYDCWRDYCTSKESEKNWITQVKKICKTAKSSEFKNLIQGSLNQKFDFLVPTEIWLIRHNITFHIWLHSLKWKIFG